MKAIEHKPTLNPITHDIWNSQRLLEYDKGFILINLMNDDPSCHEKYIESLDNNFVNGKTLTHVIINDVDDNIVRFLAVLVEKYPNVKVILPQSLSDQISKVVDTDDLETIEIVLKTELEIGEYKLCFIPAPFSVNPFNMFTIIKNKGIMFTGSFLASRYKFNEFNCHIYLETIHKRQYNFGVAFLVETIRQCHEEYAIETLIPSYNFEVKYSDISVAIERFLDINKIPESHDTRKQYQNIPQRSLMERNKALIVYSSVSMSTKELAYQINKELSKHMPCDMVELTKDTLEEVYRAIPNYRILCIGSPTFNREPMDIISSLLFKLHYYDVFDTNGFAFGSYSWSSEAVDAIHSRMQELGIRCVEPFCSTFNAPIDVSGKVKELLDLDNAIIIPRDEVGNFYTGHFYDGIMRMYKCQICSQEYEMINIPHKCLNCGAPQNYINLCGELTNYVETLEKRNIVIIGGGCAGLTAAMTARQVAKNAEIVMISNEHYLPYNRISVTNAGFGTPPEKLILRSKSFYEKLRIKVLLDTTVTNIDTKSKIVQTDKEGNISYSQLVVCTGAEPIKIFKKYKNLFYVRRIEDVIEMDKYIVEGSRGAIIGGGVLGMEILSELPTTNVDVIEKFTCLCKQAPWNLAKEYVKDIEKTGVKIYNETEVVELITKDDGGSEDKDKLVTHIKIKKGEEIIDLKTDWVIVAIGVKSVTLGLGERKIKINSACLTENEDIYACGDCSIIENGHYVETWSSATQTATVAGFNAAIGKPIRVLPVGDASFMGFGAKVGKKKLLSIGILNNKNGTSIKIRDCKIYLECYDKSDEVSFCACYGPTKYVGDVRNILINGVRQRTPKSILSKRIIDTIDSVEDNDS